MIRRIGAWLIGGVVVVVLIGTVLGTPVFIGHVQTTSMEPALSPGDGFVAVAPLGGEPVVGQTVVYRTQEEPRRLIVHQIVEKRQGGYVTQGLNSPFSDQAGGAVDPIRQGEYPPGTNQTSPYEVTNGRLIPEVVILEAEGADARFVPNRLTIGHGESATVTFHLRVPPTEGQYTITHAVHRYPAVLPPSVIHHLHRVAAPLATAAILGVVLLPIIIIFQVVVGPGRTRLR